MLLNIEVVEKKPFESMPSLQAAIRDVESALAGRGRVLIRYSGTESRARVMVEGEKQDQVEALAQQLADELQRSISDS